MRARQIGLGAAALVLVVGLVVGAFLLGRGPSAQPAPDPTPGDPTLSAPAPDPTSSASVSGDGFLEKGPVTAGQGGEPTGPGGVRINYRQTPEAAVQAAINYNAAASAMGAEDKAVTDAFIDAITIDDEQLRDQLKEGRDFVRENPDDYPPVPLEESVAEYAAGAYAIREVTPTLEAPEAVDLVIWSPDSLEDPDATWSINLYRLVWSNGDWKLRDGFVSGGTGVYKDPVGSPPSAAEKFDILKNPPASAEDPALDKLYTLKWLEFANAPA